MTTIFRGITNGGANRFFEKNGEILVAGADVGGRQVVTAELIAEIWGADIIAAGNVTGDNSNPTIEGNGTTVRISGNDVGGTFRFAFDTEKEAANFLNFLDALNEAGVLDAVL